MTTQPTDLKSLGTALSAKPSGADHPETLVDYLVIFWRFRLPFLCVVVVCLVAGLGYTLTRKKTYDATALVVVTAKPQGSGLVASAGDPLSQLQALTQSPTIETQVGIISSDSVQQRAFNRLNVNQRLRGFGKDDKGHALMAPPDKSLSVGSSKETDIITITAKAFDGSIAAGYANLVAETYLQLDRENAGAATGQAKEFVLRQLGEVERQFNVAASDLANFEKQNGLVSPEDQIKDLTTSVASTQSALTLSLEDLADTTRSLDVEQVRLAGTPSSVAFSETTGANQAFTDASAELTRLQSQLVQSRQEYAEDSATVRTLKDKVTAQEKYLASLHDMIGIGHQSVRNPSLDALIQKTDIDRSRVAGLRGRLEVENSALLKSLNALKVLPGQKRVLLLLQQNLTMSQTNYSKLSDKYHDLLVAESSVLPGGYILSKAARPLRPSGPKHLMNMAIFGVMGFTLGLMVVSVAHWRDKRIHSPTFVEDLGLLILGDVPYLSRSTIESGGQDASLPKRDLVKFESVRLMRNSIFLSRNNADLRVLCVTGSGKGEGKTSISSCLAAVLGAEGKQVLIVDANQREPRLHEWAGVSNDNGLGALLNGEKSLSEVVQLTHLPNVSIVTSGPSVASPSDAFGSISAKQAFEEMSARYDVVVVDTPSSARYGDAQQITHYCQGVLFVVAIDQTRMPDLYGSVRNCRLVGANIVGAVLNHPK